MGYMTAPASAELLRRIVRFDIDDKLERYIRTLNPERCSFLAPEKVKIGPDDLEALLNRLLRNSVTAGMFRDLWICPLTGVFPQATDIGGLTEGEEESPDLSMPLPSGWKEAAGAILRELEYLAMTAEDEDAPLADDAALLEMLAYNEDMSRDGGKKTEEIRCPSFLKKKCVDWYAGEAGSADLRSLPAGERGLLRQYTEELAASGYVPALRRKAFASLEGDAVFAQDREKAEEDLLCLRELDPDDGEAADALGIIWLWRAEESGAQEAFEKAYYFFTVGAAEGTKMSILHLADCFRQGYGTARSVLAAESLCGQVCRESLKNFVRGADSTCYADAAFRLADMRMESGSYEEAYCLALQAEYALKRRMAAVRRTGDMKLQGQLSGMLRELRKTLREESLPQGGYFRRMPGRLRPWGLEELLSDRSTLSARVTEQEGRMLVTIRRVPDFFTKKPLPVLLTIPRLSVCRLTDTVTSVLTGCGSWFFAADPEKEFRFDRVDDDVCGGKIRLNYYDGEKLTASFTGGSYTAEADSVFQPA